LGCAGYTEFATNVGNTTATLNGGGTAGAGGTDVYFEYWPTASPGAKRETVRRDVPGGAGGPFRQDVTGLEDDTAYSFRLCGSESDLVVCAQTRTFATGQDNVQAWGATSADPSVAFLRWQDIDLSVLSGPLGETPTGSGFARGFVNGRPTEVRFDYDAVSCIEVDGNVADIGFPDFSGNVAYARLEDNGPSGSGTDRFGWLGDDRSPPGCSTTREFPIMGPLTTGDIAISDNGSVTPTAKP
jgi:hypothetical protein